MNKDKVLLSVEELKEMGDILTTIMTNLDLLNIAVEGLSIAEKHHDACLPLLTQKFCSAVYYQNQAMYRILDKISFDLLECDNAVELKKQLDQQEEET